MDKDLILSGQGDNVLLICAKDNCKWSQAYPQAEPLTKLMEEGVSHTRWAHESSVDEMYDLARQYLGLAQDAIENLEDQLKEQGANPLTLLAYHKALVAQEALEVLAATGEELAGFASPQRAFFNVLAGPEYEGMGMPRVICDITAGLPDSD